jgi:hypothetical protein
MKNDKMQESRFELKYFLTEEMALRMRDFVRSYLDIDEYGKNQPNQSYPTLSLYLDSDDLQTYWHTINGNKNRFKLRLRYYDDKPDSPVFFEIKRRMNNIILKQRAGVRKSAVRLLLAGHLPDREHLFNPNSSEQWFALQHFIELMARMEAKPKMHIAYMREAYENADNNAVRLTFDRAVESAPNPEGRLIAQSDFPHRVFDPFLVLELKFTERFPNWFRTLVEHFECVQGGAAKYAEGIFTKGENWVNRARKAAEPEQLIEEFLAGTGFPRLASTT